MCNKTFSKIFRRELAAFDPIELIEDDDDLMESYVQNFLP